VPRPFFSLFAAAAVAVLTWFHAGLADAQPSEGQGREAEKVRLEYRGLEGCPDAAAFRAAVARRVAGDWEASPGELARRIDVVVSRLADGYVATIQLLDAEGQRLRRAVRGSDCGDVVNGIALVTALAIEARIDEALDRSEPEALAATSSSGAPVAPATPIAPSAPGEPAPATVAPAAPATAPAAPAAPAAAAAQPSEESAAQGGSNPVTWRASVRGGFVTGIAPRVAPGLALAGVLELEAARLGVSVLGFSSGRVTEAGVDARFDLLSFRFEGCPVAFELGSSLALEPCASFEAGALWGQAYSDPPSVEQGQSGRAPWLAPGALGRLVGSFGQLVVELEGAVRFPLRREEFYVEPQAEGAEDSRTVVHDVPGISFGASVGIGIRF